MSTMTQPTAQGTGGAAATVDSVATTAATDVLRQGGNAVDAAVAAAAVLGVTEPFSCGIGGGGFMVIRTPDGEVTTIDSREKSPAAMRPNSFFENGSVLSFNDARYSGLSGGVPGHGRRLGPRAAQVRHLGFRPRARAGDRRRARGLRGRPDVRLQIDAEHPVVRRHPVDRGALPRSRRHGEGPRDRAAQPGPRRGVRADRAARREEGLLPRRRWPRRIVDAVQDPPTAAGADKTWRPGLMTLAGPASTTGRSSASPRRSSTAATTSSAWARRPPAARPSARRSTSSSRCRSTRSIRHRPAPLVPRGVALRVRRPQRVPRPTRRSSTCRCAGLLSDSFAAERHALINADTAAASPSLRATPTTTSRRRRARAASSIPRQSTTHLTVADAEGTVVSYTFTIESTGGNGIVVPGWGFLVNNELTDFNIDSLTHPNWADGGKRPRSSMAPTIVTKDGATVPCDRLSRRLDDHHHGPAGPDGAARRRKDAAAGDRGAPRQPAQHGRDRGRAGVQDAVRGRAGRPWVTRSRRPRRSAPRRGSSS